MSRTLEQLDSQEKQLLVQEILDKKNGGCDKDWGEIALEFDLECNPETLRKAGVGVKLASDAGMEFNISAREAIDRNFLERQKMYDLRRGIRKDLREFSRTELICESIREAIKGLPKITLATSKKICPPWDVEIHRELIVGVGDFHYGASFCVYGLYNEIINKYNPDIFSSRMRELHDQIVNICVKENPEQITVMIVGDMLDGMLRASQLQRLEYGIVDSAMHLAEELTQWFVALANDTAVPIRVAAVRGNHGEIRPLGTKAGQFPEENMERIVMHYLRARFDDENWIFVIDNDAPMQQMIDVCGYKFLLLHGQGVNIESLARDCVNQYHHAIDGFVLGHLHKQQTFQSGILNGTNVMVERIPSICGVDPYAQSQGYGGKPGATCILIEKGYGRRCVYPIVLE